jgi:tRNA-uridine 2-sulfurtransferase
MAAPLTMVGMSGGVDSSVAAWSLLKGGHRVEGLFMDNWAEDDDGYCTAAEDFQDARQVCTELDIPLHRASFADEYRDRVFAHFLEEYRAGRTPNPDVLCNREIKFGALLEYAQRLGADRLATGHYARIEHGSLLRARDADKDQTYFLRQLDRASLARAEFPLGGMLKSEVRDIARKAGFDNFAKKDSTGICFIGERPFREFLQRWLPAQHGDIVTDDGEFVGRHHGLMYYTFGQRAGLGIGGVEGRDDAPWYVIDKEPASNRLVVGQGHDHPSLMSDWLVATHLSWIDETPPDGFRCTGRIRHRQADRPCVLEWDGDDRLRVRFDAPQRAVTPGQYVVLYDGERCLGGGVIMQREQK